MDTTTSTVTVTEQIDADPPDIYHYLINPEKLKSWLFPSPGDHIEQINSDLRIGGKFSFLVKRNGELLDHIGEYLELQEPKLISFTWALANVSGADKVAIEICTKENVSEVCLKHYLHPDWLEYAEQTKKSWQEMLQSLKNVVERKT